MPLTFDLHTLKPPNEKLTVTNRKLKNINIESFAEAIEQSDLIKQPATDTSALVDQYNTTLEHLLDAHAPARTREMEVRFQTTMGNEGHPGRQTCTEKGREEMDIIETARSFRHTSRSQKTCKQIV